MSTLSVSQQWAKSRRADLVQPLAAVITTSVLLYFLFSSERMWHWFVMPTLICGLLISFDAARWFSGEYDLFDPKGIIGVFGWYFFFLAPLIFIHNAIGMSRVVPPPDWRPWVGYLAILNIIGISIYQLFQRLGWQAYSGRTRWVIKPERIVPLLIIFIGISIVAQLYYFQQIGGISGVIASTQDVRTSGRLSLAQSGLGLFRLAGSALPIFILLALTLRRLQARDRQASLLTVGGLLVALALLQFFVSGLAGNRSATVFSLFLFATIVHYYWRRLTRNQLLLGILFVIAFMYVYGFYKAGGLEQIERLRAGESFAEVAATTGRDLNTLFIGDYSRVYVQSYQIYRLATTDDYDLRWGKTYLTAIVMRLPTWLWAERPADEEKVIAGTDLFFGSGAYEPSNRFVNASWVYGLSGEAMLNFGIYAAPVPFASWGFIVGYYRRTMANWQTFPKDARYLLTPVLTLLLVLLLSSDLGNVFVLLVNRGTLLFLFVLLLSVRTQKKEHL